MESPEGSPSGRPSGFCLRDKVSNRQGERQLRIRGRFDQEPMSDERVRAAERLFAKLAVRRLLRESSTSESAGLCLHRRAGRALTPQEGGPAGSESEQSHEPTRCDT